MSGYRWLSIENRGTLEVDFARSLVLRRNMKGSEVTVTSETKDGQFVISAGHRTHVVDKYGFGFYQMKHAEAPVVTHLVQNVDSKVEAEMITNDRLDAIESRLNCVESRLDYLENKSVRA